MDQYPSEHPDEQSELIKKVEAENKELNELMDAADAMLAENQKADEEQ